MWYIRTTLIIIEGYSWITLPGSELAIMMQSNTDCVPHEKPVYSFEDHCDLSNSIIYILGYP